MSNDSRRLFLGMLEGRSIYLRGRTIVAVQQDKKSPHETSPRCQSVHGQWYCSIGSSHSKAYIELCDECNLGCPFCMADSKSMGKGCYLPLHTVLYELSDLLQCLDITECWISGGEPTLHPYFSEIVWTLARLVQRTTVITNGLLLDDDNILAAISQSIVGCQVSLLSVNKDGLGTWDGATATRVLSNAEQLRSRLPYNRLIAHYVLTALTVDSVDDMLHFTEDHGYDQAIFTFMKPNGRARQHPDLRLGLKERIAITRHLHRVKNSYSIDVLLCGGITDRLDPSIYQDDHEQQSRSCASYSQEIAVTPKGQVFPCPAIADSFRDVPQWPTTRDYRDALVEGRDSLAFPGVLVQCPYTKESKDA